MAKRGAPGGATPPRPGLGTPRKNNVLFVVCEGRRSGATSTISPPNCDILRRDPSTDVYRILEVLGIVS
jgi:hypothetical protein